MKYVYLALFLLTFFTSDITGGSKRRSNVKGKYVLRPEGVVSRRANANPICVISISPHSRRGRELMAAENGTQGLDAELETMEVSVSVNDSAVILPMGTENKASFGSTPTVSPAPSPGPAPVSPEKPVNKPSKPAKPFVQLPPAAHVVHAVGPSDEDATADSVPSPGVGATIEWTNSPSVEVGKPTTTRRPAKPTHKPTRPPPKPSRGTFKPTNKPTYKPTQKPTYRPKPPAGNKPSFVGQPDVTAQSVSSPGMASYTWGSPPSRPQNNQQNRPSNRPQNRPPFGPPHYPDNSDYDYSAPGESGNMPVTVVSTGYPPSSPSAPSLGPAPSPAIGTAPGPDNNYQGIYQKPQKPQRPPHGGSAQRPPHRPPNKPAYRPPQQTNTGSPSYPDYDSEMSGYVSSSSPGTGTGELKSIDDVLESDCIEVLRSHTRKPSASKATSLRSSLRRNTRRRGLRRRP